MGTPVTIKNGTLKGRRSLYEQGLSLVFPFFGEEKRFDIQFRNWCTFSEKIKESLQIIVSDDNGNPPIHELMTPSKTKRCNFNLSIYRILDDLKFNTPGALNLGVMAAATEWVLIMDSDCLFDSDMMDRVLCLTPDKDWHYKFPRHRITKDAHWAKNTRYLPCTILFHKNTFLKVNGFDEDFTGQYSKGYAFFDNHFDKKIIDAGFRCGRIPWITATEYMDDFVGERVQRQKSEEDVNRVLMYKKINGASRLSKDMLRFSWELKYQNDKNTR